MEEDCNRRLHVNTIVELACNANRKYLKPVKKTGKPHISLHCGSRKSGRRSASFRERFLFVVLVQKICSSSRKSWKLSRNISKMFLGIYDIRLPLLLFQIMLVNGNFTTFCDATWYGILISTRKLARFKSFERLEGSRKFCLRLPAQAQSSRRSNKPCPGNSFAYN